MTQQHPPQGWPPQGQQQNNPQPGQLPPQQGQPPQQRQAPYPGQTLQQPQYQGQPQQGHPGQAQQGQFRQSQPPQYQPSPAQPQYQQGQPSQYQQQFQQQPPTTNLADGEWHRLHKLTPWAGIIGGIFASAFALFWVVVGLFGAISDGDIHLEVGLVFALGALLFFVILALTVVGTILGYRNRQFRLTSEVFEMRSGVIGKANRQARLDRLQSVNLNRPVFARIFGLTILETSGAGKDADIKLMYLGKDEAELLRAEILRRASGAKRQKQQQSRAAFEGAQAHPGAPGTVAGSAQAASAGQAGTGMPAAAAETAPRRRARTLSDYIDAAVDDFASPELPAGSVPEPAVVRVSAGRIAGAGFLSTILVALGIILGLAIALIPFSIILAAATPADGGLVFLIGMLSLLGFFVFMIFVGGLTAGGTMISSLNYTIAGTPDGIRVGRGALSQTSDTVPPGRIHAVQVRQPWLWRPFKWYEVKVDRADLSVVASSDSNEQAANLRRQVILPVGTWDEVQRVLALVLPMHMSADTSRILATAMSRGKQDTFVPAPARSWWLHPVQWKSLGYAIDRGVVYLRKGRLTRRVALVPGERIQSVTLHSSPLERAAGVVSLWLNTVGTAVTTRLPGLDAKRSVALFDELEGLAVRQAAADTSHRWHEAQARTALATARMAAADAAQRGERVDPYSQRMLDAEAAWMRDQAAQRQPQASGRPPQGVSQQQAAPFKQSQQPGQPQAQQPMEPRQHQPQHPNQPLPTQRPRPNQSTQQGHQSGPDQPPKNPDGMPPLPPMEPRQ
ncbi:PH domain-containing protein [Gulosibacter chungangensis]|uniref:PH domain-containing protein n=1 Tax=Gulosibacter chungangensis TaxID=979746 RepID=A0A7J5B898_9MICO|nr:PH domain-containing protein [Gulosibacter chungangensis]KAB1640822.1 PH domain-containing protein [Gulosibacter chungangensis]